jgi:hypothetical protein
VRTLSGVGDGSDQVERAFTEASFASKVEKENEVLYWWKLKVERDGYRSVA